MMPVLPIRFRTFLFVVLSAVLFAGCDQDGSNGNSPGPEPAEPHFDLTGYWSLEPIDCEFSNLEVLLEALLVAGLETPEFPVLDGLAEALPAIDLEQEDLESDLPAGTDSEFHIHQTGNDLEIAFEDIDGSDVQVHGTIIGDQIRFSQSEELVLQPLEVELRTEVRGTVLNEDRMALAQESDWSVRIPDGEPEMGTIDCTHHATRN